MKLIKCKLRYDNKNLVISTLKSNRWNFASGMGNHRSILDEFVFGFVFTYIIIFLRRQYKKQT